MTGYESPATRNAPLVTNRSIRNKWERGFCEQCEGEIPRTTSFGPVPIYCSGRCRQAAYRARKAAR